MDDNKANVDDALKTAQGGVHVPEKDFSSASKIAAAEGKMLRTPSGFNAQTKEGKLRNSGHSGAHRIGRKK